MLREVTQFTCRHCGGAIPPRMRLDTHERTCLKNPAMGAREIDLRSIGSKRTPSTSPVAGMRVITFNVGAKQLAQIDELVRDDMFCSRSEAIRCAVTLMIAQLRGAAK